MVKLSKMSKIDKWIGVFFVVLGLLITSCSNNSELKFMGKNLSAPCEEFEKHLEKKGFKHSNEYGYDKFEGIYLGEEVSIVLEGEKNGHYTHLTIIFGSSDMEKSKKYYDKICKEIEKEHNGFKKRDKVEDDKNLQKKEYYNEKGKDITIVCGNIAIVTMVCATFESEV